MQRRQFVGSCAAVVVAVAAAFGCRPTRLDTTARGDAGSGALGGRQGVGAGGGATELTGGTSGTPGNPLGGVPGQGGTEAPEEPVGGVGAFGGGGQGGDSRPRVTGGRTGRGGAAPGGAGGGAALGGGPAGGFHSGGGAEGGGTHEGARGGEGGSKTVDSGGVSGEGGIEQGGVGTAGSGGSRGCVPRTSEHCRMWGGPASIVPPADASLVSVASYRDVVFASDGTTLFRHDGVSWDVDRAAGAFPGTISFLAAADGWLAVVGRDWVRFFDSTWLDPVTFSSWVSAAHASASDLFLAFDDGSVLAGGPGMGWDTLLSESSDVSRWIWGDRRNLWVVGTGLRQFDSALGGWRSIPTPVLNVGAVSGTDQETLAIGAGRLFRRAGESWEQIDPSGCPSPATFHRLSHGGGPPAVLADCDGARVSLTLDGGWGPSVPLPPLGNLSDATIASGEVVVVGGSDAFAAVLEGSSWRVLPPVSRPSSCPIPIRSIRAMTGTQAGSPYIAGDGGIARFTGDSWELLEGSEDFVLTAAADSGDALFVAGYQRVHCGASLTCEEGLYCSSRGYCVADQDPDQASDCGPGYFFGGSEALGTSLCIPLSRIWRRVGAEWVPEVSYEGYISNLAGINSESMYATGVGWNYGYHYSLNEDRTAAPGVYWQCGDDLFFRDSQGWASTRWTGSYEQCELFPIGDGSVYIGDNDSIPSGAFSKFSGLEPGEELSASGCYGPLGPFSDPGLIDYEAFSVSIRDARGWVSFPQYDMQGVCTEVVGGVWPELVVTNSGGFAKLVDGEWVRTPWGFPDVGRVGERYFISHWTDGGVAFEEFADGVIECRLAE